MRILGQDIPRIGMGCWAIGGPFFSGDMPVGYANANDAMSLRTIHAAVDAGIRIFDTAAVYGTGHSEKLLGEALKQHQDSLIISKLGFLFDEQTKQILGQDHDSEHVASAIDESLSRLQRDRIDIMLLHLNALPVTLATPIFEQMEHARQAGKIRAYGWSTDYPESVESMAAREGFIGIEHAMNVFVDVPTILRSVETNDLISFVRSPLAMGVLTGKYGKEIQLPSDDVRATKQGWLDYFCDGRVNPRYLDDLGAITEVLKSGGRTLSQGALGWLMAKSDRCIPLPGARTVDQIRDNAGAIYHGPLPADAMDEIERLFEREPEGKARER